MIRTVLLYSTAVIPKYIRWIRQSLACIINELTSIWIVKSERVKLINKDQQDFLENAGGTNILHPNMVRNQNISRDRQRSTET